VVFVELPKIGRSLKKAEAAAVSPAAVNRPSHFRGPANGAGLVQ